MAQPSQLIQHIESYVDASRSPPQQVVGLEGIVSLLKNDVLTVESLVREMEMYLTTTDNIIRARGILLLGDVLTGLSSKPLDNTTIHTLLSFFTERLADWRALRGALVGCLALMRRRSNGVVTSVDAEAVAKSYLQSVQVQSLAQHDRKLCFELLECLLERFPDTAASLGEELTYGICEAVDGEKDPHCLMLTFHIVEVLVQLFPYPSDALASYAGDLFGILACYFPIHFTHQNVEDFDVKKEDLSRALMHAFSSTPLFEPFAMPLLLEKLSSSLTSAKADSLKYLNHCTSKYGADRMAKHTAAIWSSLKDAIYPSGEEPVLFFTSESVDDSQDNEIAREALALLEKLIIQNNNLLLSLMFSDEEINMFFNTVTSYRNYEELSLQSKQKLYVLSRILYVSVKASAISCNRVFERFFPTLMEALEISVENENELSSCNDNYTISARPNFGALYLCIQLLGACRDLIAGSQFLTSQGIPANETWYRMVCGSSSSLSKTFCSVFSASTTNKHAEVVDIPLGVKGLQILATFPGGYSIISKSTFDSILNTFVSIITLDFDKTFLWKLALKALVYIGSSIHGCNGSEKSASYMVIVVEGIVSLLSSDDGRIPFPLKLEAMSQIGTTGMTFMLNIVLVLEEVICVKMAEVYAQGNLKSGKMALQLLECYSNAFLPWIQKYEDFEQALMRFVIKLWNQVENCRDFCGGDLEKELLDATMKAMKLTVASCSVEGQSIVMDKIYTVLSSSACLSLKESLSTLEPTEEGRSFSDRDEWILSLFSSVIIALRPQTRVPNIRTVLRMLMSAFLNGNISAAQALGSLVNKLDIKPNEKGVAGDCTFEEVMDMIFSMDLLRSCNNGSGNFDNTSNGTKMSITNLYLGAAKTGLFQIHAIFGLAWIAKGLLMRGHEKVKDLTMVFLECLVSFGRTTTFSMKQDSLNQDIQLSTMKCAADAFQILMCDSELCLNRKFHATIRPLYKQRFFSTVMPILLSLIIKPSSSLSRSMLHRAIAHVISDTPLIVILNDAKKLISVMLDGLTILAKDILDKDILYSLLLVLSGILTNKNGQEAVIENAHSIINCLVGLIAYPHMMVVRETTIQCLAALSELPHARIYPMRLQVVQAVSKALDDPRRNVRQEAVKCRQAWASM